MAPALFEISYTLVTVGLLSFFFYIPNNKQWSRKRHFLWWIFFGTIFNLYSLSWLYTVYPLIWMPAGPIQLFGIALLHVILSVGSGACFFVVGYGVSLKVHQNIKPMFVGLSFTLAEIFRSLVISLLYLGKATTIGLHFNSGTIGNALSTTPLVEFAYYGGTFALTFVLTFLLYSFFTLSHKRALSYFGLVVLLLILTHVYAPTRLPSHDISVGVTTTDIPTLDGDKLWEQVGTSNATLANFILGSTTTVDIIALPEDARFLSSLSTSTKKLLREQYPNVLIIDGDTTLHKGRLVNVSSAYQTATGETHTRGKELLLPFNEYIPYFFDLMFRVIIGNSISAYERSHTYTPVYESGSFLFGDLNVATLICSEILSFDVLRGEGRNNADIIFYQSRLNVFNNNPWFLMHLRSFSKIAAAQLRTTIISSNNYAPAYMMSVYGKIVGELPVATSYTNIVITRNGGVILKRER